MVERWRRGVAVPRHPGKTGSYEEIKASRGVEDACGL
jgi:hypothetical protein